MTHKNNNQRMRQAQQYLPVSETQKHPFHVLSSSKLPILVASFAGFLALSVIAKLHAISYSESFEYNLAVNQILEPFFSAGDFNYSAINAVILSFVIVVTTLMGSWSASLFKESVMHGHHTLRVQLALKYGMLLFLVSEAMLFFPFFWAFFHGALSPTIQIGGVWPPVGIRGLEVLNPFMLPPVNTVVLLCSGVAVVAAHRAVIIGHRVMIANALYTAISFGILFSWLQFIEYGLTQFTINDGLFGSVFFMLTGLHGFHVIVGTTLLIISYWRTVVQGHYGFSAQHHIGFELAAWYWHFVDVVWLGVFAFIYIWGV